MNDENDDSTDVVDDTFPPINLLTHVRTTKDNLKNLHSIPLEIHQYERKWGFAGIVTDTVQDNEHWYEVMHETGDLGCYHVTELILRSHNDDSRGDDDSNDDPTPEPDFTPTLKPELICI